MSSELADGGTAGDSGEVGAVLIALCFIEFAEGRDASFGERQEASAGRPSPAIKVVRSR